MGSEMCIRDSFSTVAGVADLVVFISAFMARKLLNDDGFPQAIGCLLYTSDAADERSSVDLGGRRIIKKKNKIHKMTMT